jgi:hypothetical protein
LGGFPSPLDPVNVSLGSLLQEGNDADPRVMNSPSQLLELGLEEFIFRPLHHLGDPCL